MEKIIPIGGRDIKFKSTGAFLLRYKMQFKRDAIRDIYKLESVVDQETKTLKNMDALDMEVFYNLVWTLAKTADPSIPPPLDWLDSFPEFPLMDIVPEVMDMIFSCMVSSVNPKKKF